MTEDAREQLLRAMGEAASLSPDDPQRKEILDRVAREDSWVEQEWLDLLQEDERTRLELQRVTVPPDLERCLLSFMDRNERPQSSLLKNWYFLGAVALFLMVFITVFLGKFMEGQRTSQRLQLLALLATQDHVNEAHLTVETGNPANLERSLQNQLPFVPMLPVLGPEYRLKGGRRCALGTHPVVYSLWDGPNGKYSLYQFQPLDFNLPSDLTKTIITPKEPNTTSRTCKVMIWIMSRRGYMIVADKEEDLKALM